MPSTATHSTAETDDVVVTCSETRPAGEALVKLLRAVVEHDCVWERLKAKAERQRQMFGGLLYARAEVEPKVKRLRDRGKPDRTTEKQLRKAAFDETLPQRWQTIEQCDDAVKQAARSRKAALDKLYGVAQAVLDYAPPIDDAVV